MDLDCRRLHCTAVTVRIMVHRQTSIPRTIVTPLYAKGVFLGRKYARQRRAHISATYRKSMMVFDLFTAEVTLVPVLKTQSRCSRPKT